MAEHSNQQHPRAASVLLHEDASSAGPSRDHNPLLPMWEFSNNLAREINALSVSRGFPGPVAPLTVVENTVFHQDLPHAHGLSSGVNAGRLLQHPVHQFGPHTALSKGRRTKRTGGHPL